MSSYLTYINTQSLVVYIFTPVVLIQIIFDVVLSRGWYPLRSRRVFFLGSFPHDYSKASVLTSTLLERTFNIFKYFISQKPYQ